MKYINKLEEWLGGTLFIAIFRYSYRSILHKVFHSPLIWSRTHEILFVYVGYVGYQRCCENKNTYLLILTNLMPEKIRRFTNAFYTNY